jgi:hypothetical protein
MMSMNVRRVLHTIGDIRIEQPDMLKLYYRICWTHIVPLVLAVAAFTFHIRVIRG